jgi:CRISPR-associated endonuclease Cas2
MARPKKANISLKERLLRIKEATLRPLADKEKIQSDVDELLTIPERIQLILGIIKSHAAKSTRMNYLILYDIEDNRVRVQIAKYLKQQGCVRIQKSVFLANSESSKFQDIYETLKDVNEFYENKDSIILVPINVSDVRSMRLIGSNVDVKVITEPGNTYFF